MLEAIKNAAGAIKNTFFHITRLWFRWLSADEIFSLPEGPALVIAPHPDDETIGCGGAIARFCKEGRKVYVLIVTNGDLSTQSAIITPDELTAIRRQESLKAMIFFGLPEENISFLSYPDNRASDNMDGISQAICEHIAQISPAVIFTTHEYDEHPDHRAVASIVGQLQDKGEFDARVLQYPVWYNVLTWPYGIWRCLFSPSLYRRCRQWPITDFWTKKNEALLLYRSQFENLTGEKGWRFFSAPSRRRFCDSMELFFERSAQNR